MAVRDDLDSLDEPNERAHLLRVPALEQTLEREVRRARDVAMTRIAVRTGEALELGARPHVEKREVVVAETPPQLVERHVCH
jgi:hypothetical protein